MSGSIWDDWAEENGYDYDEDDRSYNEFMERKLSEDGESGIYDDPDEQD